MLSHQPILELRPECPAGNHGRTGQLEPRVSDGVLLEKSCWGNVSFSRSLSVLTFSKLLVLPNAFFHLFPVVATNTGPLMT